MYDVGAGRVCGRGVRAVGLTDRTGNGCGWQQAVAVPGEVGDGFGRRLLGFAVALGWVVLPFGNASSERVVGVAPVFALVLVFCLDGGQLVFGVPVVVLYLPFAAALPKHRIGSDVPARL